MSVFITRAVCVPCRFVGTLIRDPEVTEVRCPKCDRVIATAGSADEIEAAG